MTAALQRLEGRGLIGRDRGTINVIDRKALEKVAGSSYGVREAEYRRLIGWIASLTAGQDRCPRVS